MHICFITNRFPSKVDPNSLVFLKNLIWSMADNGVRCTVICPSQVNIQPKLLSLTTHEEQHTESGRGVHVFRPRIVGLGQSHYIAGRSPIGFTANQMFRACKSVLKKESIQPDCFYGHFMAPAGVVAVKLGKEFKIPSFVACGESSEWSIVQYGAERLSKVMHDVSGIIAVSSKNRNMLLRYNIVDQSKIEVIPNGINEKLFYQRDRSLSREKMGLPARSFIAGYCGVFNDRKGILRLQAAVEQCKNVFFACAGKGELIPTSEKCLYKSPVSNAELPYFYSAMDIFVLPTKNEGCCNAILEAMACGLPVVSSDREFNHEILDGSCSILVKEDNIQDISWAISALQNNENLRRSLADGALAKSKQFTLGERSRRIIKFIRKMQ